MYAEETIGPTLDRKVEVWEDKHPCQATDAGIDNVEEGINSVEAVTRRKSRDLAEEEGDDGDEVTEADVPKDPADAELEGFRVFPD